MRLKNCLILCLAAGIPAAIPFSTLRAADAVSAVVPAGYQLLYQQEFGETKAEKEFVYTDASAWKVTDENGEQALELVQQSKYEPKVRSPFNIALIADREFGDFILEADLRQTGREYGHRDMCLFFGWQNPSQFYYVHMASVMDDHAHNVFIVNNEPRTKISLKTTEGVAWGQDWHHVRLERKVEDGTIKVFFDDMEKPIMTAKDKAFGAGYVGFGSFDDTGKIRNVKIWGPKLEKKKIGFYQRKD